MKTILSITLSLLFLSSLSLNAQLDLGNLTDKAKELAADYDIPPEIVDQTKELAKSFGLTKANLSKYATDALKALNGGEDVEALNLFSKIGNSSLTSGQKSAYQDLKVLVDTYILKKELEGDKKAAGPLGEAISAITSGDYATVASQLGTLVETVKPTGDQLTILGSLKAQYEEWADADEEK